MNNLNKLQKILYSILCCAFMASAVGCEEIQDLGGQEYANAVVTLRVDEVFQEKAYVRLNHDGSQDDFWFYVLTEDLETDAVVLLGDDIAGKLEADGALEGNVGTNRNITFEGLDPKTEYRVIAARITPAGEIIGNVAELRFKTMRDPDVFELHPSWKMDYKERRTVDGDVNEERDVFSCVTGASKDTYVPCLLTKTDFANTYKESLRACFEDYIAYRNLSNTRWNEAALDEDCEHVEDRLRSGDYLLFMIGVDTLGTLTGYYAQTEYTLKQETASDEYAKWVGKWTLKGSCGEQIITYPVEIKAEENNLYYRLYGWESTTAGVGLQSVSEHLPILLYFEKSTGDVYVVSEELPDYPDFAGIYYFYLFGCIEMDYEVTMTEVPVDISNLKIARLRMNAAGNHAAAYPEKFIYDLNGNHYDTDFLYFNYSYIFPALYQGLVPVTTDSKVPRISTIVLDR